MMDKKIRHELQTRLVILFTGIGILFNFGYTEQEKADSDLVISWIGHSCYEIKYHNFRILLDPHTPEWFDYSRPKARFDIVFATHKAADHFYFEGIEADEYLLSSGAKDEFIRQRHSEGVAIKDKTTRTKNNRSLTFWTVASFHDDQGGAADGVNGILCFDFGGIKVVHLGDLGHILEKTHLNKIGPVDVLMIPVDGYYTIDIKTAKAIIQQLDPRIVLPMHYKTEKSSLTAPIYTEKNLLEGFPGLKRIHRSRLDIDKDTLNHRQQVIILDYLNQEKNRFLGMPHRQDRVFSHLKGPYLGQKPPGMTPEIFAPGIISTLAHEYSFTVSADGSEIFFTRHIGEYSHIYYTKIKNGRWIAPRIALFSGKFADYDQCFAPDGNSIYFVSDRPRPGTPFIGDIWFVTRTKNGWSAPKNIGSPVNTEQNEACPSLTKDRTLYFHAVYPEGAGRSDIYASKYLGGKFSEPLNLGRAINSEYNDSNAFIAQDESYIIFGSRRPGGFGNGDLYISFRDKHGKWTEAVNMGDRVNSQYSEYCPSVSPDGKFLFFTRIDSSQDRKGDIYWMDAGVIEELRSEVNRKTNSPSPSE